MKKLFIFLLIFVALFTLHAKNYLRVDLDRDGRLEKVVWKPFVNTEAGTYYRLFVYDDSGKLLWKGPKSVCDECPFTVASLDYGVVIPEIIVDINKDGYQEMLTPQPQSDVSPTWYKRLKWKNGAFHPMHDALLQFFPPNRLHWRQKELHSNNVGWASNFRYIAKNRAKVSLYRASPQGIKFSEVVIRFTKNGAKIIKWLGKEKKIHYRAELSQKDHYNSRGTLLHDMKSILVQDRANYHKGKRDSFDSDDGYFYSKAKRAKIYDYKIVPVGISYSRLKELILNHTPKVNVTIKEHTLYIKVLR